jgi:hypothetical protein
MKQSIKVDAKTGATSTVHTLPRQQNSAPKDAAAITKLMNELLHVEPCDANSVRTHCMPWVQGCPARCDAVCAVNDAFVLLFGASVTGDMVPPGMPVLASGLVVTLAWSAAVCVHLCLQLGSV